MQAQQDVNVVLHPAHALHKAIQGLDDAGDVVE